MSPARIVLCANSTSWDTQHDRLIPGGQGDRYLRPILNALPPGSSVIARQPQARAVNAYMNHRTRYRPDCWRGEHTSVLISHGIASKTYRDASACASYAHTTAPGPALAAEIVASGVPHSKVHIVGYPKLDPIHRGEVASPWPARDGRIRVLWAPTHGGGSEAHRQGNPNAPGAGATTWWHRDVLLSLLDPARVLILEAPHPRHSKGHQATFAQYVGADVVIADGGSTMYEAWLCGLPVVFADWLTARRNLTRAQGTTLEARVYREAIGWHVTTPGDFAAAVEEAAANGITACEVAFAEEVLPSSLRGHGGKLHAELLLELASSPPSRHNPRVEVPMKFISAKYPNLDLSRKAGLAGVRFVNGLCEVNRPSAVAILQSPWWQRRGVRLATEEDLTAIAVPVPTVGPVAVAEPDPAGEPVTEPAELAGPAPETPTGVADTDVPAGTSGDVLAWVGDDPGRARRAAEVERQRDKPRSTLLAKLDSIG